MLGKSLESKSKNKLMRRLMLIKIRIKMGMTRGNRNCPGDRRNFEEGKHDRKKLSERIKRWEGQMNPKTLRPLFL